MSRKTERARARNAPSATEKPRVSIDPTSYLQETPVWRFSDFDWDGDWGYESCAVKVGSIREHIEMHLASFETMTWNEILRASGGRRSGNNSHEIERDKFKLSAQERLNIRGVFSDTLFSLRLNGGTRIYGVREGRCLRVVFFDPHHKDLNLCAYNFTGD